MHSLGKFKFILGIVFYILLKTSLANAATAAATERTGPLYSNLFIPKMQPAVINEYGVQIPQYNPHSGSIVDNSTISEETSINVVTATVSLERTLFSKPVSGSELSLDFKLIFSPSTGLKAVYGPAYVYAGLGGLWINTHYLFDEYGNKYEYIGWPEDTREDAYGLAVTSPDWLQGIRYRFRYDNGGYYTWTTKEQTTYYFTRFSFEYANRTYYSYRLSAKIDKDGNGIFYRYDNNNRLINISAGRGYSRSTVSFRYISRFSRRGRPVYAYANTASFDYMSDSSINISYSGDDRMLTVSSGDISYEIETRPGFFSIRGPDNYYEEFEYFRHYPVGSFEPIYYLTSRRDPKGNVTGYFYRQYYPAFVAPFTYVRLPSAPGDEQFRLYEVLNPNGSRTTLHHDPGINYDLEAKTTEVVDCNGNRSLYIYYFKYDPFDPYNPFDQLYQSNVELVFEKRVFLTQIPLNRGIPIPVSFSPGRSPITPYDDQGVSIHYNYDDAYNLSSLIDYNWNEIRWEYDFQWGDILEVTDPEGGVYQFEYNPTYHKVILQRDPMGRETSYTLSRGNVTSKTDAAGNITRYGYDTYGNMTSSADARGNSTTYENDNRGNLIRKIDPHSGVTSYSYNHSGDITSETDARGNTTTYDYDGLQRLTRINYPDGTSKNFQYDENSNKIQETDENGHTARYEYDALDRLTAAIDPLNSATRYEYDGVGNKTREIDANGHEARYGYDELNRLTNKIDALGNATVYEYTENFGSDIFEGQGFKPNRVTDAGGNTTEYIYDRLYRLRWEINPYNRAIEYGYDAAGNKLYEQDFAGYRTEYTYDELNRMISKTDQIGNTTTYSYDSIGNLVNFTDANGNTTFYTYDNVNRLSEVVDTLGGTTRYSYDPAGNVASIERPNGSRTGYGYTNRNRLEYARDDLGNYTYFNYDGVGNLTQKRDPNGNTIDYQYNAVNLLTSESSNGNTVNYNYDPVGNRTQMQDTTGVTAYNYDALDRLQRISYPNGKSIEYEYDPIGNRTTMRDSDGDTTSYEYNALNQPTSTMDPDGNTTTFEYDTLERRIRTRYPNGITLEYWYDEIDRILSKKYIKSNGDVIAWLSYTYDNVGNRLSLYDIVENETTSYGYDSLYRLTNSSYPEGNDIQYSYDSVGNRVTEVTTRGDEIHYTYNSADQLTQQDLLRYRNQDIRGAWIRYQYDNNGNLIRRSQNYTTTQPYNIYSDTGIPANSVLSSLNGSALSDSGGAPEGGFCIQSVVANGWGGWYIDIPAESRPDLNEYANTRLTFWVKTPVNLVVKIKGDGVESREKRIADFGWNGTDNWQEISIPIREFTNDGVGLNSVEIPFLISSQQNTTFYIDYARYGGNLDLIPEEATAYNWDYNNQLTQCTLPVGHTYIYTYNGDGNRVRKQTPGGTEQYLYDGLNILKDLDSSGNTLVSYTQELDLDQLISLKEASSLTQYYHTDAIGSVRAITNGGQNAIATYNYDAWGNVTSETGSASNKYTFTGRQDETEETGLLYYRARYYDPTIGRFISQDPFTGGPDDARIGYSNDIFEAIHGAISEYLSFREPHRFNRYTYCNNNPTSSTDPLGLFTILPIDRESTNRAYKSAQNAYKRFAQTKVGRAVDKVVSFMTSPLVNEGMSAAMLSMGMAPGNKSILIGENMARRVIPTAEETGSNYYKPWGKNAENWLQNNKNWLRKQIKNGTDMYDIGQETGKSRFYRMEIKTLHEAGYKRRFFKWIKISNKKTRLYRWLKKK